MFPEAYHIVNLYIVFLISVCLCRTRFLLRLLCIVFINVAEFVVSLAPWTTEHLLWYCQMRELSEAVGLVRIDGEDLRVLDYVGDVVVVFELFCFVVFAPRHVLATVVGCALWSEHMPRHLLGLLEDGFLDCALKHKRLYQDLLCLSDAMRSFNRLSFDAGSIDRIDD